MIMMIIIFIVVRSYFLSKKLYRERERDGKFCALKENLILKFVRFFFLSLKYNFDFSLTMSFSRVSTLRRDLVMPKLISYLTLTKVHNTMTNFQLTKLIDKQVISRRISTIRFQAWEMFDLVKRWRGLKLVNLFFF